jgi:corrinoid protein of di/trimethylamine methyltransferase
MTDRQELFSALHEAVLGGDDAAAGRLAEQALASGVPALAAIEQGLMPGIREAGKRWEEGEYFLPELVTAAGAMKTAMVVLQSALGAESQALSLGRVVIGTVEGDIHDIGKTLVATMLSASGFAVSDEGASVSVPRFLARARELDADLVCASALLTTTMPKQRELVAAVRQAGLKARVMVGGAPVSKSWADAIGADGFADNALAAVRVALGLVGRGATA